MWSVSPAWLSVVLSHPSNGRRRTDVPFSTDVEGEGAWDEDDGPMPAGPRNTKRGGARRRRTSDAVEPIAFRRPVMAKSAVKGVTARSGVEARATAGASYFPAARSLNSASLVAGKSPQGTGGVVASTSRPSSGRSAALAKFKGAGLAVLAQQQDAARLGREEVEPTDQGLSQTLSTVISAEETETTESDNNEPEAQFPPVPGMILPQESDSSSEEDSIPGESSEEDSIPDEIPQAAPEEKPEEKPKEEEPPKPKKRREVRRRSVANIPSADMVLVNELAKKTGKKAPTSFKKGNSFSKLPRAQTNGSRPGRSSRSVPSCRWPCRTSRTPRQLRIRTRPLGPTRPALLRTSSRQGSGVSLWRCPTRSWTECRYCPGLPLFDRHTQSMLC